MAFLRLAAAALCLAVAGFAQETDDEVMAWIRAHYTKHEFQIPMRDGVRLYTAIYTPKDTTEKHPILLTRTPYSLRPYGVDQFGERLIGWKHFLKAGYIIAVQDVRGRWASEGEFVHVRPYIENKAGPKDVDETTDTWDTIEWMIRNVPNHNGRAGMWGISYPGFYAAMGAIDAHPALKAVSPQAPVADWFLGDDFHHNGAFFLAHAFNFMINFERQRPSDEPLKKSPVPDFEHGTPNGYEFFLKLGSAVNANEKYFKNTSRFWNELISNGRYNEYWQARSLPRRMRNIKPAMMTVGGWFDAEDVYGPLKVYSEAEKNNPAGQNILVMGPWYHGQWSRDSGEALGHVRFDSKTGDFYRERIELPFFEFHLKDKGEMKLPEAYVFETGRNQWRRHDSWPPKEARGRTLYFGERGKLDFQAPSGQTAFDEYTSDPWKPVPVVDYPTVRMTREYMVDDQRFASTRPDVLVYRTPELEEDVTVAGPVTATLYVSTTGTDADFIVKLIDVYPDDYPDPKENPKDIRMGGYQQLVRGEPFRGRFRQGFDKAVPFTPNRVTKIEFEMPDVYHTFRRGHRIMVHVQSTWFPLVDRNPQKFVDVYSAKEEDYQKATHRVYRSREHPSGIKLRVLPWM